MQLVPTSTTSASRLIRGTDSDKCIQTVVIYMTSATVVPPAVDYFIVSIIEVI